VKNIRKNYKKLTKRLTRRLIVLHRILIHRLLLKKLDVQPPKKKRKPGIKKRGGQPGHEGHSRFLYPVEDCKEVTDYYPQRCSCCGEELTGSESNPHRHQVVEIPPIKLEIIEHRLHQ